MKKIATLIVALAWLLLAIPQQPVEASLWLGGTRSSAALSVGPPVSAAYGADADAGEVDDPTLAASFSLGSTYYAGTIVNNGGTYYYALKSSRNVATSDTTYWRQITNVYYFDNVSGNDANAQNTCTSAGTTNATLAKANPCQTMQRAADLLDGSGSSPNNVNAPTGSLILFKRGQNWDGHLFVQQGTSASFIIGAWGTGARPNIRYSISGGVQVDGDSTIKAGPGATAGGLIVRNVTIDAQFVVVYRYTAGVGTFANGDSISQTADGLKSGIVQEQRTFGGNTYISVVHSSPASVMSNGVAFQTAGGAKTGTTSGGSGVMIAGMMSQVPNWSIWNFTVQNTVNNGLVGGYYGDLTKGVNIVAYNGLVQDSALNGGNGAGADILYGNNVKVLHVTLKDNGANNTYAHNLYFNDLDDLELGWIYSYMTRGDRGNHCIVLHGAMNRANIHDSLLDGCQNGLGINDGYNGSSANGGEYFDSFTVVRNVIRNMGIYGGAGYATDLRGVRNSTFANNLAYNNLYPFNLGDRVYDGITPIVGTATLPSANNVFAFNTIVGSPSSTQPAVKVLGALLGAQTFIDNIIESKSATTSVYAFQWDALSGTAPTLSYNDIYNPNFTGTIRWGSNTYTVGAAPIGAGNTAAAPTFVNEGAGNYAVSGSPKTLGTPYGGYTTDITGAARSSTTPTIGAYE